MKIPRFPEDFRVAMKDGVSFWVWGPNGPSDEGPCLMVSGDEDASHILQHGGEVVVSWEYGPEADTGPHRRGVWNWRNPESVQQMVEAVILEVAEEETVAVTIPVEEITLVTHRWTHAIHPCMEWCAYREGEEELGGYGWGATEKEAIDDYMSGLD